MNEQFGGHRMYFPQYRKGRVGIELFAGTILEHARQLGIAIDAECGGRGTCGKCRVRVNRGREALCPPTEAEQILNLGPDERLACLAQVVAPGDVYVYVTSAGAYTILSDTVRQDIELNPAVTREGESVIWHGPAGDQALGDYDGEMLGLAVDVGTTTIACQVLDLQSGETLATVTRKNPQGAYGDDVISRIDHTMRHEDGLAELQATVISAVNDTLNELARRDGLNAAHIYEAVAVGNPTMRNIFFGLDVKPLGVIPFEAPSKDPINVRADSLGLKINPAANVYGPALIGGHAGADCLADIIAARMHEADKPCMIIDIGTNGEVAIGNSQRIMTASCAAGGAYEGATVSSGVGAIAGAISNVFINNGDIRVETIGDQPAIGICGSGLIDLLAQLLKAGIMTQKAKLDGEFHLTDSITLSQQDVYQLITAKAGLRTDQDLLVEYYGLKLDQVDKLFLAGGFGNYINVDNAIAIGLLPDVGDRVVKIGNAALAGAADMLLSLELRRASEVWAAKIEHTRPNEVESEFAYLVAENMYF